MDKRDTIPQEVREEVAKWVELTSLRHVAGQIGIGHSTVERLLKGSHPYDRTRAKVLKWYEVRPEPPARGVPYTPPPSEHAGDDDALDAVRELVRQRVERTSLRALEKELGVNRSTIHKFLEGSKPHARLLRLYRAWYDQHTNELRKDTRYRNIPVAELRRFFLQIVDEDSLRIVADAAGMVRSTVAKFVNGADPDPQTVRLLGLYYLYEKKHGDGKREALRNRRNRPGNKARQKRPQTRAASVYPPVQS